jgi:hypothetical protein
MKKNGEVGFMYPVSNGGRVKDGMYSLVGKRGLE